MSVPKRVRVSRRVGGGVPDGARYVGRPTKWGNPVPVSVSMPRAEAVEAFRVYLVAHPELARDARRELRGLDLACWCPLDGPCHADVLLAAANSTSCLTCGGTGSLAAVGACQADTTNPVVVAAIGEIRRAVAPCDDCAGAGVELEPL